GDPEARNNTATQITGYLIAKGLPLEVVEVIVKNWNVAVNETPLATQEINTVVRSVAKKDARSGKNRVNPLSNKLYTRFSATSSVEEKPSIEPKEIVLAEQYKPQEVKKESQIIQEQLNNLQIIFHGRTDGKSCEDTA
ncbi:primase C-terminal domain-containing protein, partial [candidate division NPL-UPA2 bacterium]|nr:primase C-terminal domain-containing protein [candidate division NPL-UPA2 bacterium]